MSDLRTTNALPKLPGFHFAELSQPVSYNKSHIFGFNEGVPSVKAVVPGALSGDESGAKPTDAASGFSEKMIFAKFPLWKSLGDKALRFFGYFTERVHESAAETFRVRKVRITFTLMDGAIAVAETPAVANSGLKIGTMMSRHVEPNVNARNLAVGSSIMMRGREFHLVDCDAFTRQFYEAMGIRQDDPLEYPPDKFEALVTKTRTVRDPDHIQMKRNVEMQAAAISGHQASLLTPEEREKARNFLEHDRVVLNFSAVWQMRHFRINFYVADATVAIMNDLPPNSGRDPNGVFMRRQKAPIGRLVHKAIDTINVPRSVDPQFVTATDLITGSSVVLFDREFLIYDCDPFTKMYYQQVFGIDQASYPKPQTEADNRVAFRTLELPPSNGYGTEDDSVQSYRSLVPKAPKKDFAKFFKHANDVLRFHAVHAVAAPEDEDRVFIFCYYLADDTVSIYEHPGRNSGHVGGKISARGPAKGIKPEMLEVEACFTVGGQQYRLTAMDDRTKKFLDTGISMGTSGFGVDDLLHRVRHALSQRFVRVTEAYRHFSTGANGITLRDLVALLKECEIRVDDPAVVQQIMEAADRDRDGVISLAEFIEHVMGQDIVKSEAAARKVVPVFEPGKTYADLQQARAREDFANSVLKLFITKLEARRAFIVDTFRIVSDKSLDGLIGVDVFKTVVQEKLALNLAQEELDALIFKFFYVAGVPNYLTRRLTLREFRRIVEQ
jgi:EF-hand domain-containing protein 1